MSQSVSQSEKFLEITILLPKMSDHVGHVKVGGGERLDVVHMHMVDGVGFARRNMETASYPVHLQVTVYL